MLSCRIFPSKLANNPLLVPLRVGELSPWSVPPGTSGFIFLTRSSEIDPGNPRRKTKPRHPQQNAGGKNGVGHWVPNNWRILGTGEKHDVELLLDFFILLLAHFLMSYLNAMGYGYLNRILSKTYMFFLKKNGAKNLGYNEGMWLIT